VRVLRALAVLIDAHKVSPAARLAAGHTTVATHCVAGVGVWCGCRGGVEGEERRELGALARVAREASERRVAVKVAEEEGRGLHARATSKLHTYCHPSIVLRPENRSRQALHRECKLRSGGTDCVRCAAQRCTSWGRACGTRALAHGTGRPTFASTVAASADRSSVDLPLMLGPVSSSMPPPAPRRTSFGTAPPPPPPSAQPPLACSAMLATLSLLELLLFASELAPRPTALLATVALVLARPGPELMPPGAS
jgi:hypothetical protein